MDRPLITLTTDFGEGSPYVASMKGVVCSLAPDVHIVDITHAVRPQDLRHAAFVLWQTTPFFPEGTIHIVVVDPGVGTERSILYAEIAGGRFIAPDNGTLSWTARHAPPTVLRTITEPKFWRHPVSATFHGRDIMAPVAAHLARGVAPQQFGPETKAMATLAWPDVRGTPQCIEGEVLVIDSFGNLITNVAATDLQGISLESAKVTLNNKTMPMARSYADAAPGSLIALIGSSDLLEIAVTNASAAGTLNAAPGAPVTVRYSRDPTAGG
jgi:S-adenosylmethionine hydrolase